MLKRIYQVKMFIDWVWRNVCCQRQNNTAEETKTIKETKSIHAKQTSKRPPEIIRDGFSSSSDSSSSRSGSRISCNKRPMNNQPRMMVKQQSLSIKDLVTEEQFQQITSLRNKIEILENEQIKFKGLYHIDKQVVG